MTQKIIFKQKNNNKIKNNITANLASSSIFVRYLVHARKHEKIYIRVLKGELQLVYIINLIERI